MSAPCPAGPPDATPSFQALPARSAACRRVRTATSGTRRRVASSPPALSKAPPATWGPPASAPYTGAVEARAEPYDLGRAYALTFRP